MGARPSNRNSQRPSGSIVWPAVRGCGNRIGYHSVGRSAEGGNNLIVEQNHEPGGGVPLHMAPLIVIATVISHLFGASVGREGTAVQLGGSIASAFGKYARLEPDETRILLMAGIAAGPVPGRAVERTTEGCCAPREGALYPTLKGSNRAAISPPRPRPSPAGNARSTRSQNEDARRFASVSAPGWMRRPSRWTPDARPDLWNEPSRRNGRGRSPSVGRGFPL